VIEHNLDVIKTADWLIDMGPAGGHKGGLVIAAGTPEEVAEVADSYTGEFLRRVLGLSGKPKGGARALARATKANGTAVIKTTPAAADGTDPARAAPAKAARTKAAPARVRRWRLPQGRSGARADPTGAAGGGTDKGHRRRHRPRPHCRRRRAKKGARHGPPLARPLGRPGPAAGRSDAGAGLPCSVPWPAATRRPAREARRIVPTRA
jgi:hypothetical protein